MKDLKNKIEEAYQEWVQTKNVKNQSYIKVINSVLELLDKGTLRVAEKINNKWVTHDWIKKSILLSFVTQPTTCFNANYTRFFDKFSSKFFDYTEERFKAEQLRVVPNTFVRKSAYIAPNCILMPCFVNVGAFIDSGTMIDTWSTIGSCAQIGKNVHISGGVGIGGVLEPIQSTPTVIEDNCFIGARSEIVEGVIIEEGSVISMGVFIGQSTRIFNRLTGKITYGIIPAGSVVIPGTIPAPNGQYATYAAIIVKNVDYKTKSKTEINEILRSI